MRADRKGALVQRTIDFDEPPLSSPHLTAKKVLRAFWAHLHQVVLPAPKFPYALPTMVFTLKGTTAGQAHFRSWIIRINQEALDKSPQETRAIIRHEACHLYAMKNFGTLIKPHGPEWQKTMEMAGQVPDRCHTLQLTPARTSITFGWECSSCFEVFQVSRKRHLRMSRAVGEESNVWKHKECRRKRGAGVLRRSGINKDGLTTVTSYTPPPTPTKKRVKRVHVQYCKGEEKCAEVCVLHTVKEKKEWRGLWKKKRPRSSASAAASVLMSS